MADGRVTLDAKLELFDRHSQDAVDDLIRWLQDHRDDLIAVARGRHVLGHYLYQDRNFTEYDVDRLRCETGEELADAIVYTSRRLFLEGVTRGDASAVAEGSVAG